MRIVFIRHGKTKGNLEKRYIGRTDESLCSEGIRELEGRDYPDADIVVCSPMKRCIETADIIYPEKERILEKDLRECDFGDFEGKNYSGLNGNADYQAWIDSGGTIPFPGGERHEDFTERCCHTFTEIMKKHSGKTVAFVVHGGTIMSILERYALPAKGFYDYQIKNCCGYTADYDDGKIIIKTEF